MPGRVLKVSKDAVSQSRDYYSVTDIIIDMSGWKTRDTSILEFGIYPFVMKFKDCDDHEHVFASDLMEPKGFDQLASHLKNKYKALILDDAKITLVCPSDANDPHHERNSCIYACDVRDLRYNAMEAFNFVPTAESNINIRLESVLDDITHRACSEYSVRPKTRDAVFENSIYGYAKQDNISAADSALIKYDDMAREYFE